VICISIVEDHAIVRAGLTWPRSRHASTPWRSSRCAPAHRESSVC